MSEEEDVRCEVDEVDEIRCDVGEAEREFGSREQASRSSTAQGREPPPPTWWPSALLEALKDYKI
jgi:hypothetical protein